MSRCDCYPGATHTRKACPIAPALTDSMRYVLAYVADRLDGEAWWHDLPYPTRLALWDRGLIEEVRKVPCTTHGLTHACYVGITAKGQAALARWD